MVWFEGSVRTAVDKVKSSGIVLLVFVHGNDSLSKKYETFLNEETKLNSEYLLALKLSQDSVTFQQFKQIYVNVPVPSVFLIQNNGIPVKIISSDKTNDITKAICEVVKKEKQKKPHPKIKEDVVPKKKSNAEATAKTTQRVKNIGHKFIDVSEEELQKRIKEIRAFPRFFFLDTSSSMPESSLSSPASRFQSARIQFRLPNNDTPSWEFPDLSTLGDVRAYLMEKMNLSPNFKLLKTYPRTAFTPQDEFKTLRELSLTPSASLIVVPVQDKTVQARMKNMITRPSFFSTLLKTFLQPFLTVFKYFKKHILKIQDEPNITRGVSETATEKLFNKKTSTSNIHSFKFEDDVDPDVEHPDNGNSTQQQFPK